MRLLLDSRRELRKPCKETSEMILPPQYPRRLLIFDGIARVERDGQVIARLKAGDFCGEMSLIDGMPRCATVIAETPAVLLVVHRRSFGHLLNTVPGLQKKVLAGLCERLRAADSALGSRN